ncbi:hypothetical protein HDU76_006150, partial [Blyttiomyces sp. JEL0837]
MSSITVKTVYTPPPPPSKSVIHAGLEIILSLSLLSTFLETRDHITLLSVSRYYRQHWNTYCIHQRAPFVHLARHLRSNKSAMVDAIDKEDEALFKGILWAIPTEVYETEEWRSIMANILINTQAAKNQYIFKDIINRGYRSNPTGFGIEHKILAQANRNKRLDIVRILLTSPHWRRIKYNLQAAIPNKDSIYNVVADSLKLATACAHSRLIDILLQELPRGLDATNGITIITKALEFDNYVDEEGFELAGVPDTKMIEKLVVFISDIRQAMTISKLPKSLQKAIFGVFSKGKGEFVETLILGGIISARSEKLLLTAVEHGHEGIVQAALDAGVDPDVFYGKALDIAVENGDLGILKLLINAKSTSDIRERANQAANPHSFDKLLVAPFNTACSGGLLRQEVVEYLLSIGAPVTCKVVFNAVRTKGSQVLTMLINAGINLTFIGKHVLMKAILAGNLPAFQTLIKAGVSPNHFNGNIMRKAAEHFNTTDCPKAIEILINAGSNVNLAMPEVLTTICSRGITDAFDNLLKANIDLSLVDGPKLLQVMQAPNRICHSNGRYGQIRNRMLR